MFPRLPLRNISFVKEQVRSFLKQKTKNKRIETPIGMLTAKQQIKAKQADETTTNTFYYLNFFKNMLVTKTIMNLTIHWQNKLFMHYKFLKFSSSRNFHNFVGKSNGKL